MTKPKTPKALDAIADVVLKYRPTSRSEPARQRKRRKTILENRRKSGKANRG
jgi:hypothetical protein